MSKIPNTATVWPIPVGAVLAAVLGNLIAFSGASELREVALYQWTEDMPYGAALAVKEAKEAGVQNFRIFYPITEHRTMLNADPVIVGYSKTGQMFELFAWDNGKIYE